MDPKDHTPSGWWWEQVIEQTSTLFFFRNNNNYSTLYKENYISLSIISNFNTPVSIIQLKKMHSFNVDTSYWSSILSKKQHTNMLLLHFIPPMLAIIPFHLHHTKQPCFEQFGSVVMIYFLMENKYRRLWRLSSEQLTGSYFGNLRKRRKHTKRSRMFVDHWKWWWWISFQVKNGNLMLK